MLSSRLGLPRAALLMRGVLNDVAHSHRVAGENIRVLAGHVFGSVCARGCVATGKKKRRRRGVAVHACNRGRAHSRGASLFQSVHGDSADAACVSGRSIFMRAEELRRCLCVGERGVSCVRSRRTAGITPGGRDCNLSLKIWMLDILLLYKHARVWHICMYQYAERYHFMRASMQHLCTKLAVACMMADAAIFYDASALLPEKLTRQELLSPFISAINELGGTGRAAASAYSATRWHAFFCHRYPWYWRSGWRIMTTRFDDSI